MTQQSPARTPGKIMSEAIELISEELDEIRDMARNGNRDVLAAVQHVLSEVRALREDLTAHQAHTNAQITHLRRKAENGPTPAK